MLPWLSLFLIFAGSSACTEDGLDCGGDCSSSCGQFCLSYAECFLSEAESIGLEKFAAPIECGFAEPGAEVQACIRACEEETTDGCAACLAQTRPACGRGSMHNCSDDCGRDNIQRIRHDVAEQTLCAATAPAAAATCEVGRIDAAHASPGDGIGFNFRDEFEGDAVLVDDSPIRALLSNGSTIAFELPSEVRIPAVGSSFKVDLDLFCGLGCSYVLSATWPGGFFGVWRAGPTRVSTVGPLSFEFSPTSCASPFDLCGAVQSLDLVLPDGTKVGVGQRGTSGPYEVVLNHARGLMIVDDFCTDVQGGISRGYAYQR